MKFLKLTYANGNKVRINFENIISYGVIDNVYGEFEEKYNGYTYMEDVVLRHKHIVKESLEYIDEKLGVE